MYQLINNNSRHNPRIPVPPSLAEGEEPHLTCQS